MKTRIWLCVAAVLCTAGGIPRAGAQTRARTVDELVNRAGTRGPSQTIGGAYTTYGQNRPLEATRADVALLSSAPSFFRSGVRGSPYTAALGAAQVGVMSGLGTRAGWAGAVSEFNSEAAVISGLHAATSRFLWLPGVRQNYLPRLDACLYTPRPAATRFDEVFGMRPSAPPASGPPVGTLVQRLEAETSAMLERTKREGLELFQQATVEPRTRDGVTGLERYRTCAECEEKLSHAIQRLRTLRDMDSTAYLPPLLMAHAYLEQDRPALALNHLLEALKREPDLLERTGVQEPLDAYFGDGQNGHSAYLAVQMRRFARYADQTVLNPSVVALSAYCTWRLGETDRARAAAVELERQARDVPRRATHLLDLALALQAVLQPN